MKAKLLVISAIMISLLASCGRLERREVSDGEEEAACWQEQLNSMRVDPLQKLVFKEAEDVFQYWRQTNQEYSAPYSHDAKLADFFAFNKTRSRCVGGVLILNRENLASDEIRHIVGVRCGDEWQFFPGILVSVSRKEFNNGQPFTFEGLFKEYLDDIVEEGTEKCVLDYSYLLDEFYGDLECVPGGQSDQ